MRFIDSAALIDEVSLLPGSGALLVGQRRSRCDIELISGSCSHPQNPLCFVARQKFERFTQVHRCRHDSELKACCNSVDLRFGGRGPPSLGHRLSPTLRSPSRCRRSGLLILIFIATHLRHGPFWLCDVPMFGVICLLPPMALSLIGSGRDIRLAAFSRPCGVLSAFALGGVAASPAGAHLWSYRWALWCGSEGTAIHG